MIDLYDRGNPLLYSLCDSVIYESSLRMRSFEGSLIKNWNLEHLPPLFLYSITSSISVKALYISLISIKENHRIHQLNRVC
jgi:hypothetical protein